MKKKDRNVALIGFMGTGKSRVGKQLADELNRQFYDTDELIEKEEQRSITAIFREKGEKYFRERETELLQRLCQLSPGAAVVATGGGAVIREKNLQILLEHFFVVALLASPEEIFKRVATEDSRPLLQTVDPLAKINTLLEVRMPLYKKAHLIINTGSLSPLDVAKEILKHLQKKVF